MADVGVLCFVVLVRFFREVAVSVAVWRWPSELAEIDAAHQPIPASEEAASDHPHDEEGQERTFGCELPSVHKTENKLLLRMAGSRFIWIRRSAARHRRARR